MFAWPSNTADCAQRFIVTSSGEPYSKCGVRNFPSIKLRMQIARSSSAPIGVRQTAVSGRLLSKTCKVKEKTQCIATLCERRPDKMLHFCF
mmetsp:Transcript_49249/g.88964  ORF Transcript_49249/g.88964 Transcript_49249/m.88964 type:complete len:91 (+) Transcript_49249:1787-2059(+)